MQSHRLTAPFLGQLIDARPPPMITGPGPWHITREYYERARQILIDRGWPPPPGADN